MRMPQYIFNRSEQVVETFYLDHGFTTKPINPEKIANLLGICWRYEDADSTSNISRRSIVIDANADPLTRREDFAHELAHIVLHCESQLSLPGAFVDLQERQASNFALYILVPSHMLLPFLKEVQLEAAIGAIASAFHVSLPFAKRRYQKLMAQIEYARSQQELAAIIDAMPQYGRDYDSRLTIGNTEYFYS